MLDLGVLKSLLRQISEDERSERHNFAHDGRVAFINSAPALIAELRALRADETMQVEVIGDLMAETTTLKAEIEKLRAEVARVIERFKDAEGEQTLMEVVEAVFLNGEAGWKLAHELQDANRWRPIAEAREDDWPIVLIDIHDPGRLQLSYVCSLSWTVESLGMTHFSKIAPLSYEQADALIAALPDPPEGA